MGRRRTPVPLWDHAVATIGEALQTAASSGTKRYRVNLTTDAELHEWVHDTLGIDIPRKSCCPGHVAPFTAFCHAYFARDEVAIWKAARGLGGKTLQLALLALTEAITLGAGVTVLGGSGEQAARVLDYMRGDDSNVENAFWEHPNAPTELIKKYISRKTSLKNGGFIHALMASTRSVRGPHPQRLRLDEADETTQQIVEAALGQPMEKVKRERQEDGSIIERTIAAQAVLSSTWHEPAGTMTWLLKKEAPAKGWPIFEWCYHESVAEGEGWLTEAAVEAKRRGMTRRTFLVECDLQEPNPEARIFDVKAIAQMFVPELGIFPASDGYTDDWTRELVIEEPEEGALYATGTDWAKDVDWTWIITYRADYHPAEVVAIARYGRMPWPEIAKKLDERMAKFPGRGYHDSTGVGKVVTDYLNCHSEPYDFVGKQRSDLLAAYILACEHGKVTHPVLELMVTEHEFAAAADVWGPNHLPDSIAAAACGWKAVESIRGADMKAARTARARARRKLREQG